ncbi:MAG: hypothetical protein WKF76_05735 [Nocardioidaceae bacterium]
MPLPTLVIAGAQKCGTSSLVTLLRQHPQVSMSRPKELHFFDRHFDRGLDWYREQFTMGAPICTPVRERPRTSTTQRPGLA